jgi:uncharacterized protein GlcG (DUF336 family)
VQARRGGAWVGGIDIAIHKARTARAFDMPTEDLGGTVEQVVEAAVTAVRENRDGGRSSAG